MRLVAAFLSLLFLAACGEAVPPGNASRILLLGDSMFASNKQSSGAVADAIEAELGLEVVDRSVSGASYFYPLPISGSAGLKLTAQFRPGPWDVIVMNGGGNDLLFGCGCGQCDAVLDRLISSDGRTGAIPDFVRRLQATGAKVFYSGYLRNPGSPTPIRACGAAGNELDRRLALLDQREAGMVFLPMSDLVPFGSLSFHQVDRIHPSRSGSQAIGARIAAHIAPVLGRTIR